jgi:hypothetical protein
MIKAQLGSMENEFDLNGDTDDTKPDYLFQFVHLDEEFRLDPHARYPVKITNLLVRMIIDANVPLFENEEGFLKRLNQDGHLDLPNMDKEGENWYNERLSYWRNESMFVHPSP